MSPLMTRVYVDMVADLFHHGHVAFLRQARELGDELIVGVHSDEAVASYKRTPVLTMAERIAVVETCRYVDQTIANAPLVVSRDWVDTHDLDLVAHGDDFSPDFARRFYAYPMEAGIYRVLPYTPAISTSEIVERIGRRLARGDL
jgi:cytidyltransferase-like protein